MSSPVNSKDSGGGGGGMGMNMVTTVMAFSVSAFFVLFVFTRLFCARLRLRNANNAAAGDVFVVSAYNVERRIGGLEPSLVTSFPTVKVGDGTQLPPVQEKSQCTVCLEEYEAKDVVRVLPACGHAFHAPCIDAWLRQHPTCPVCRASLRAKNHHATPLDYGRLLAAAAAAPQAPASSSSSEDRAGVGEDGRLEIITEEPEAASPGDHSAAAAADDDDGHSRCGEAASQAAAGASEHR